MENENVNQQLITRFYEQNREPFRLFVRSRFQLPKSVVDDIYQEAILAVYQNMRDGKYRKIPGCSLQTYLFQIGKNKILDYLKRDRKADGLFTELDGVEERIDEDEQEMHEKAYRIVAEMPSPCRDILFAFFWDGCSMKDIALRFGFKTEEVAKSQKYKCQQKVGSAFKAIGFRIKKDRK